MKRILVGTATCGLAAGAGKVLTALQDAVVGQDGVEVIETGCIGLCYAEPLVEVFDGGHSSLV